MKNLADSIKRVGIIANSEKLSCVAAVKQAASLVAHAGRKIYSDKNTTTFAGIDATVCPDTGALKEQVDILLVFGGDGTMLRAARAMAGSRTPILGINIGSLGFLTAVPSDGLGQALERVWKGEFHFEERDLIEATGQCSGRLVQRNALNDIVISRGNDSRLVELEVRVDGDALTSYRCDGLIFSSPTGSTAYSLAAGGAVVFPTAEVLELTPICPHTLSNRSLIIPLSAKIEVRVVSRKPVTILSADGQMVSELSANDLIIIKRSQQTVRLMHLAGSSFCETLRRKLHWRGATF